MNVNVMAGQTTLVSVDTQLDQAIRGEIEAQIDKEIQESDAKQIQLGFGGVSFAPSSIRGPGVIEGSDGDHSNAYILLLRAVIGLVQKYVAAASADGVYHVSELIRDLHSLVNVHKYFCKRFSLPLTGATEQGSVLIEELAKRIDILRESCNGNMKALYDNFNVIKKLKENSSKDKSIPKDSFDLIQKLNIKVLEDCIQQTRKDYFYTIIKAVSQQTILLQNQMEYSAFQKTAGQAADRGEGGRIAHSIDKLRSYNKRLIEEKKQCSDNDVDFIVYHAARLFFFPKVEKPGDGTDITVRTNDIRILCLLVAKHLWTLFAAFEAFGTNEDVKAKIAKKFIAYMIDNPITQETVSVTVNGVIEKINMNNVCKGWGVTDKNIHDMLQVSVKNAQNNMKLSKKSSLAATSVGTAVSASTTITTDLSDSNNQNQELLLANGFASQVTDVKSLHGLIFKTFIDYSPEQQTELLNQGQSLMKSPGTETGSMGTVDDEFYGSPAKSRITKIGSPDYFGASSALSPMFAEMSPMTAGIGNPLEKCKNLVSQLSEHEIEELMMELSAREKDLKSASSSSMGTDFFGSKNVSSTGFLPIRFSSVPQSVEESGKNIIKAATAGLELNTKKARWLPTIESGDIYNAMSKKCKNLAGEAQHIANHLTKPLLYMSRSALRTQTGLSQLVNVGIREGFVSGLKQLVRPSCSLDGTTIIPSMIRPR